jgi:tRNA(fMet)-specific endonuclease VapC
MLDSNVIIDLIRGRTPPVTDRFLTLQPGEAVISVIVRAELLLGVEKSERKTQDAVITQAILRDIAVLPLTAGCARHYAIHRAALERSGKMIGNNDLWIAAHALAEDLPLITRNEHEFRRIQGLKIVNWAL